MTICRGKQAPAGGAFGRWKRVAPYDASCTIIPTDGRFLGGVAALTKMAVDRAATNSRDEFICDDEVPGFELRVFKFGKRSYLIQYRIGSRTRRYAIGSHGHLDAGDRAQAGEDSPRARGAGRGPGRR